MLSAEYECQGLRPDGTKGVANPCLNTIGFRNPMGRNAYTHSQRMTHPLFSVLCSLFSVLCYLLSTKPSTDPLPCGTPPNLEGEFLVSICTLFSVICYLLSTKPSTDPLPCGTPPNLEGEFLISICSLYSVLCSLLSVLLVLIAYKSRKFVEFGNFVFF